MGLKCLMRKKTHILSRKQEIKNFNSTQGFNIKFSIFKQNEILSKRKEEKYKNMNIYYINKKYIQAKKTFIFPSKISREKEN